MPFRNTDSHKGIFLEKWSTHLFFRKDKWLAIQAIIKPTMTHLLVNTYFNDSDISPLEYIPLTLKWLHLVYINTFLEHYFTVHLCVALRFPKWNRKHQETIKLIFIQHLLTITDILKFWCIDYFHSIRSWSIWTIYTLPFNKHRFLATASRCRDMKWISTILCYC